MTLPANTRLLATFLAVSFPCTLIAGDDELARGFSTPPDSAKPHTWWHWVDGNVSKEGITKDLDAMERIGLGGFQMFHVGGYGPEGPVKYMSPQWREMVRFSLSEADRLGLEVTMHNAAGWANSGGPWVTPENAMKTTVWSETPIKGGRLVEKELPQPMTRLNHYRDIAVLAVPESPAGGNALMHLRTRITGSDDDFNGSPLIDGDRDTCSSGKQQFLQIEFDEPFTARSLGIVFRGLVKSNARMHLECSVDGRTFTSHGKIYDASLSRRDGSVNFPPVTARFFRLIPEGLTTDKVSELSLSAAPVVDALGARAGYARAERVCPPMPALDPGAPCVRAAEVIDISKHMAEDGAVRWNAPPGDWMLVRIGYTLTGSENRPAPAEGRGLECDKFSRPALKQHFDHMLGKVIADAGPLAGKSLVAGLIDSFEVGPQNWTAEMPGEFRRRAGYDIGPHLLALTGRIVDNPGDTGRFLNDFRRVISGLFNDNYFGYFDELCEAHGLKSYAEGYGDGNFEFLTASRPADIPMTEFWFDRGSRSFRNEWIKTVASAAHGYGKNIVAAESFTSDPKTTKPWGEHPGAVKRFGDLAYSFGINRFILHTYTHQPWPDHVVPGMTMGRWGAHFDRTNTWWNMGTAWMDYMTRCQFMLQQGTCAADVAVYTGEDRPGSYHPPELPPGVNYDYISDEVLLNETSAGDGVLRLRSGSSYRVLALPDDTRMSVAVARKIAAIANAGVAVTGPRPQQSWGLRDKGPELDSVIDGFWPKVHDTLAKALAAAEIEADFDSTAAPGELCFIHKRIGATDAYFVANQSDKAIVPVCEFRVTGKSPERWNPRTGLITEPALFRTKGKHTLLAVPLAAYESTFIVFRKTGAPVVRSVTRDGRDLPAPSLLTLDGKLTLETTAAGRYSIQLVDGAILQTDIQESPSPIEIKGPWNVAFDTRWKAPASIGFPTLLSWTEHENPNIRYYSGTATYTKGFQFNRKPAEGERQFLDLGDVREIARVRLNGTDLGIHWIKPFRIEITEAVRPGANQLEIDVVNLWPNRLIGDEQLPDDRGKTWKDKPDWFAHFAKTGERPSSKRMTYPNWKHYSKDEPLRPSGLIGPVSIRSTTVKTIDPPPAGK